jgi:Ring finger domain
LGRTDDGGDDDDPTPRDTTDVIPLRRPQHETMVDVDVTASAVVTGGDQNTGNVITSAAIAVVVDAADAAVVATTAAAATTTTTTTKCCSICQDGIRHGELVSRSHHPDCHHLFHTQCIRTWLLQHTVCPLCRRSFLDIIVDHDDDDDDDAIDPRDDSIASQATI